MGRRSWWLAGVTFSGPKMVALVAGVSLGLVGVFSAVENVHDASAAPSSRSRLTFNDVDLTNCYYRNKFFNKDVRAKYALFDSTGTVPVDPLAGVPPYLIERLALYRATPSEPGIKSGHSGPGIVRVDCDGTIYDIAVDRARLPNIHLAMDNKPPVSNGLTAIFNGQSVKAVPPGSRVTLKLDVSDSDPLTFFWAANEGAIFNVNKRTTTWKLPLSKGLHFAYVLSNDGRGGYHEDSIIISTDGGVVPAPRPRAAAQPSDLIRASDHFLTFYSTSYNYAAGADSKLGSCLYYKAIGVIKDCLPNGKMIGQLINFDTWRAKWGFSAGTKAVYANVVDLNLQRDMHGITTADGTAFYVCNSPNNADFPDVSGAIKRKGVVACVAMEYSPPPGGGAPFTKFITFGPSGKLLQSVNLDGEGEKFVPGSCVICHGSGNNIHFKGRIDESAAVDPDLQAHFLPFDLDSFDFSSRSGDTRADEEPALKALNQLVLNTSPPPAVKELIDGWYLGGTFNGDFVPTGWNADPNFYLGVVKPACRMCHVANNRAFNTETQVKAFASTIAGLVCGNGTFSNEARRYAMPNAKVTFDRFWNDEGGIGGATQAERMLAFINANIPPPGIAKCDPPRY